MLSKCKYLCAILHKCTAHFWSLWQTGRCGQSSWWQLIIKNEISVPANIEYLHALRSFFCKIRLHRITRMTISNERKINIDWKSEEENRLQIMSKVVAQLAAPFVYGMTFNGVVRHSISVCVFFLLCWVRFGTIG